MKKKILLTVPEDIYAKLDLVSRESLRPIATEALYRMKLGLGVKVEAGLKVEGGKDILDRVLDIPKVSKSPLRKVDVGIELREDEKEKSKPAESKPAESKPAEPKPIKSKSVKSGAVKAPIDWEAVGRRQVESEDRSGLEWAIGIIQEAQGIGTREHWKLAKERLSKQDYEYDITAGFIKKGGKFVKQIN
jgi:hypothetical protein